MTEIIENCIRLQKSFLNFLHSSHALWCVAAYFLRKEQMQMKLVYVKRLAKSELKLANWKLGFQFS